MTTKFLSIVIPIFDESKNIEPLYKELVLLEKKLHLNLQFIFINDGSTDDSKNRIINLQKNDKIIKIIEFTKNYGQTAAFDAGIKNADGQIIVTIDGDLQNDPSDIPLLLEKLESGFDVVAGWRRERRDPFSKRFFSFWANILRQKLTGETIHDSGCSLRVYRKEVFEGVDLYGEMHRFIPAILSLYGYKIGEVVVKHRPRTQGKSKYSSTRLFKGLLDLLFIVFMLRFASRPLHVFGIFGGLTLMIGLLINIYLASIKIFYGAQLSNRPLLILGVLMMVIGTQFFIFGLLAELLVRIYFKTHRLSPYTIRKSNV